MADTGEIAVGVTIRGRVQGVSYRAWTVETATGLGLRGWVRNRHDGSVEALFAGPAVTVEAMIAHCHEGPAAAQVDAVERRQAAVPATSGFRQLPTV